MNPLVLAESSPISAAVFLGFFVTVVNIPALIVLGVWFGLQILNGLAVSANEPGVAFWAHIGGFIAGLVLVSFFKRPEVPMLEKPRHRPFQVERRKGPWG